MTAQEMPGSPNNGHPPSVFEFANDGTNLSDSNDYAGGGTSAYSPVPMASTCQQRDIPVGIAVDG
jgi:hypothetical protein